MKNSSNFKYYGMRVRPLLDLFFMFAVGFFVVLFFYLKVNDLAFLVFMFVGLSPFYIPFFYVFLNHMFYSLSKNQGRDEVINRLQKSNSSYKCILYCDPLYIYGGLSYIPWAGFYLGEVDSGGEKFIFTSFDLSIKEFSEIFSVSKMIPTYFRHIKGNKIRVRELKKK